MNLLLNYFIHRLAHVLPFALYSWLYKEATVQAVDDVGDDCTANVKVIISQAAYGRYRKRFQVT